MASTLQSAVTTIVQGNYTALVIFTAVGYDYLLTFSDEIEYIWNKPWTRVSTLFLLARYFGLCFVMIFALLGQSLLPGPAKTYVFALHLAFDCRHFRAICSHTNSCDVLYTFGIWSTMIFFAAADLVMILRVWALYERSKLILVTLLALYAVELIVSLANCILVSTQSGRLAVTAQVLDYSFCEVQYGSPIWSEITDSAQIALGTLMCLLVAVQFGKQAFQMYRSTKRFQVNHYMSLLVKEGMIYFLAILAYALIDIMYYVANMPTHGWWILLTVLPQSIPAVALVPRFIFGLRRLYARDLHGMHGGDIDTAFGFRSMTGQGAVLTAISFADATPDEGPEENEKTPTEAEEMRSASMEVIA